LERGQPGSGATGASAGMLAVTAELRNSDQDERKFAKHSNSLWPDFAKKLEAASGREIRYAVKGALLLADDRTAFEQLGEQAGQPGLEGVSADRVRSMAP